MDKMISLRGLTKSFGAVKVMDPTSLDIAKGSFTSLLGASGCGKTTLLNMIAGLEVPTAGEIEIADTTVFSSGRSINIPTEKRNIGFVFQSYALWPHMRVLANVAYPLRLRRIAKEERERKAKDILDRLELGHLAQRFPYELSGGQQQRVAIARSLVYNPQLLLLDEPLSSLDVQLRERARAWLASLQAELKLTTVLVTHDHVEALSLSDRIILLRNGGVEQDAGSSAIYNAPATSYVAEFVGGANALAVSVIASRQENGKMLVDVEFPDRSGMTLVAESAWNVNDTGVLVIRPRCVEILEDLETFRPPPGALIQPCEIKALLYQGNEWEMVGTSPVGEIRALCSQEPSKRNVHIAFNAVNCRLLPT